MKRSTLGRTLRASPLRLAGCLLLLAGCGEGKIELGPGDDAGDTAVDGGDTGDTGTDTGGGDTDTSDTDTGGGDTGGGDTGEPVEPASYVGLVSLAATYGGGHDGGESIACTGDFEALVQPDGRVEGYATCTAWDVTLEGPLTGDVSGGHLTARWDYEIWNYTLQADVAGTVDDAAFEATVTDMERGFELSGSMSGERP